MHVRSILCYYRFNHSHIASKLGNIFHVAMHLLTKQESK